MNLRRIIKRETMSLIVIVLTIIVFLFSFLYIFVFSIKNEIKDTIELNDCLISFCYDKDCNEKYINYNRLIGVRVNNGITNLEQITTKLSKPYIFNVKNNSHYKKKVAIDIKESNEYMNKTNNIIFYLHKTKIVIDDCNGNDKREFNYTEMMNNTIIDFELSSYEEKTYCVKTYIETNEPVQESYFVANVNFNIK